MSEPTSVKSKVMINGKKNNILRRQLTFEMISGWIKLQKFDDYTTNGLIELASKYPTQALPSFKKNFNLMIERVRAKRKAELQGDVIQNVVDEVCDLPTTPIEDIKETDEFEKNSNS